MIMSMKKKPIIPEQAAENFIFNAKDEVIRKKSEQFFQNDSDITSDTSVYNDNTSDKNINTTTNNTDDVYNDINSDIDSDTISNINIT